MFQMIMKIWGAFKWVLGGAVFIYVFVTLKQIFIAVQNSRAKKKLVKDGQEFKITVESAEAQMISDAAKNAEEP